MLLCSDGTLECFINGLGLLAAQSLGVKSSTKLGVQNIEHRETLSGKESQQIASDHKGCGYEFGVTLICVGRNRMGNC